jgi:putative transposase
MLAKRIMKTRTKEQKESMLLDVQRIGVVAGCRKHGIDPSTYYSWLEKYQVHGIEGLEDRRGKTNENMLKKAEKEIRLLKEILAEKELELKMKDELLKKKMAQWNRENK